MSYHLYAIDELFTNADGTIQFVELSMPGGGGNGENFWNGHFLVSTNGSTTTSFATSNLPSSSTANTHVLLATAGFQALTGITPNFVIPNGFLFAGGGTISWGSTNGAINGPGVVDTVSYGSLPTDGHTSFNINIDVFPETTSTAENSPTNFAGATGHIVIPENHAPTLEKPLVDKVAGAGQAFTYTFGSGTFADADGQALTYTATRGNGSALPDWLDFDSASRTFSGTPDAGDAAVITVKVVASDGTATKSDAFTLTILSGQVLVGTTNADVLTGTNGNDSITGKGGPDALTGDSGKDTLDGSTGNDTIKGGGGNDFLIGGDGKDRLFGGSGADTFLFKETTGDVIKDFTTGSDQLHLDDSFFTALGDAGPLGDEDLQTDPESEITATSGGHIKYATDTGHLYYDADGSGAASGLVLIATIQGTFTPSSDIIII